MVVLSTFGPGNRVTSDIEAILWDTYAKASLRLNSFRFGNNHDGSIPFTRSID